jgi:hypothetical protein
VLVAALLASAAYLLYNERRRLVAGLGSVVGRLRAPDRRDTASGLVQLPQVFLAVFFFDILYILLVEMAGASPNVPAFEELPLWYRLFTFARASVYEEFAARVLLCGLPLLVAYYLAYFAMARPPRARPWENASADPKPPAPPGPQPRPPSLADYLRSRTTRGLWGYFLGGGFRIGPLEAFFIIGSALMFGLAHVPGWDIWKLLPTFIAGLGFAYLFLRVGLHAAILLHFSFDYLDLTAGLVPGFPMLYIIMELLWFAVGAFYFGHYVVQGSRWAAGMAEKVGAPRKAA